MDPFDLAWDQLAERGWCDERGGEEYQRIRSAWDRYGAFAFALQWIVDGANRPADADEQKAEPAATLPEIPDVG